MSNHIHPVGNSWDNFKETLLTPKERAEIDLQVQYAGESREVPPIAEKERTGRMLKGLRLRAGMTQKQLAKAIDVPQSHISEYEGNKRPIPAHQVPLLARVLDTVEGHFTAR